jgi:hypothetical protein
MPLAEEPEGGTIGVVLPYRCISDRRKFWSAARCCSDRCRYSFQTACCAAGNASIRSLVNDGAGDELVPITAAESSGLKLKIDTSTIHRAQPPRKKPGPVGWFIRDQAELISSFKAGFTSI